MPDTSSDAPASVPPPTKPPRETAPSAMVKEGPAIARMIGFAGLFLLILGIVVVIATHTVGPRLVREGWGLMAGALGLAMLLYHAMSDGEMEIRRMYGGGALFLLLASLIVSLVPGPVDGADQRVGYFMVPWGVGAALVGLLFTVAFSHHETDEFYRNIATTMLVSIGGLLAVLSVAVGVFKPEFLAGPGIILALLGVGFLCAYLTRVDTSEGIGYTVAFTLGAVGAAVALYAIGRAIFPTVLYDGPSFFRKTDQSLDPWKVLARGVAILGLLGLAAFGILGRFPLWLRAVLGAIGIATAGVFIIACFSSQLTVQPKPTLVPGGVILIGLGLIYLAVALGICSDNQFVTLTRRELSAYFLSPIGFLVLAGMVLAQWLSYVIFVGELASRGTAREPIVQEYGMGILNIFVFVVQIPVLTMRLLAEEKRTGSLEVLLTAPVNEAVVIISKFLASLLFFLICWLPTGLFLIALRVVGDQPFDYRPILGFYVGLASQGAMFIALGIFFSSLTKNQIVAAVLTAVIMLCLLFFALLRFNPAFLSLPDAVLSAVERLSFYHMWMESLSGQLPVRDVILSVSLAVFGLFLSVKILEIRKWS